ncbi:MAG: 6,7-dimethyl-8-ribityllumazine synthase [Actinomycetota bacterium]|nr:6,7-dimethyl-8-ribityllumazine synthase [Actinomycetota bacterium]
MKEYQGKLVAKGFKFAIVVSRFNDFLSKRLLEGALDALSRHDASESDIEVAWTPGSFEIPLIAKQFAESGKYDAVICLGVIIRGDTPHFDFVAAETAKGVALAGLSSGTPTIFGVITSDDTDQAIDRSGIKSGNKGWQAALSAIEMANLMREIK